MYSSRHKNNIYLSMLVLLPVVIISVVNFFIQYVNTISTIQNDLQVESYRTMEVLNTHLSSMSNIVNARRIDKGFSSQAQTKINTAYYPIVQQLREDALWMPFFSGIYYYSLHSEMVYKPNSAVSADEFFYVKDEKPLYYAGNIMQMRPEDKQSLREPGNHTRAIRIKNAEHGADGVLFAVPLEIRSDSPPLSYMMFTISDTMLASLVNIGDSTDCLLEYNGIPVYTSDPETQQALYDGTQTANGFISSDTLTFDKDGLQISWNINRDYIIQKLIPTIFLQAAVTFFVVAVGLLLLLYVSRKTYEPVQALINKLPPRSDAKSFMDEFKYIDYVLDDLMLSRRYYEESVKELRREKYLFYILDDQVEPGSTLYQQCLHEGIRVDRKYFACILMEDTEQNYDLFTSLTAEKQELDSYSLYIADNRYLFLLASDLPKQEFQSRLSKLTETNAAQIKTSDIISGIHHVRQAYTSLSRTSPHNGQNTASETPLIELQLLQEAAETDNMDKVEFALRMIKSDLHGCSASARMAVLREVYRILSAINPESYEKVPSSAGLEACGLLLDKWLTQFAAAKETNISVKKNLPRNLHTIIHYIEKNYTSPDFSIKYMAAVFGTSPSNLSHQFKKLTGQTLSRYIDGLRISKAEELLNQGEKINAIAQKLGYSTTPVFTEAYKRARGITPSMYREQNQKNDYTEL